MRRAPLSGALALLIAAAGATDASACGYTVRARARGHHATRPALILGDSTMIFAAPSLGRHGIDADAKECRQFSEGAATLAVRARGRTLPVLSILALGANGPVSTRMIDGVLRSIGRRHLLGLVIPRRSPVTEASMRAAARRHPARVLLIDWVSFSAGHGGWFAGDGLHVTPAAGRIYAGFIARAAAPMLPGWLVSHRTMRMLSSERSSAMDYNTPPSPTSNARESSCTRCSTPR
jgi:hypothetical protein